MGIATENFKLTFRIGFVDSTDPARVTAKVNFPDLVTPGGSPLISGWLQVLQLAAVDDRDYRNLDIGTQVACLFLGSGIETGVVLGALYNGKQPPPVAGQDKWHRRHRDGTFFEYDRGAHKWTVHVEGEADAYVKGLVNLVCDGDVTAKIAGNVQAEVEGNVTVSTRGDIAVESQGNISLKAAGNVNITAGGEIIARAAMIRLN